MSISGWNSIVFVAWLLVGLYILMRIVRRGKKWPAFVFIALILLELLTVFYQISETEISTISLISTCVLVPLEVSAVYFILSSPKAVKKKTDDPTILDYNL